MKRIENTEKETKQLLNAYRNLLKACKTVVSKDDKKSIKEAFKLASESHKGMRRKSGEAYIFHPVEVATICAKEIGLGATSIICALLHDVVEDTDVTIEDIEDKFGKKVADIIHGLTKISGIVGKSNSLQAENFRKIILTLAEDVRVILIKIADRLHNMRTLDSVNRTSQLKIASETMVIFAPLAHRLGMYSIKSELEDLSLKFTNPKMFKEISRKIQESKYQRNRYIRKFIIPIENSLKKNKFKFDIKGRPKSIFSVYNKMMKQDIPFEQVYDLFAIRIILDSPPETEKADCWRVYSIVTDHYKPNPERLRDWLSTPKANAYESLHTTVMGPNGKWMEVQIRSRRMHEIAEKGYAAHWKYKEDSKSDKGLDEWLTRIRELLENPEPNAIDFLEEFKLNFFSDEVFVFSPKGDIYNLPVNSTALDFAFAVHSDIGSKCIGAKVNHKLVPLSYKIINGDQVEIITSKKQKPNEDWLNFVVTAKAKTRIKHTLKDEKRKTAQFGKELLERKFKHLHLKFDNSIIDKLAKQYSLNSSLELFYQIGIEKISNISLNKSIKLLKEFLATNGKAAEISTNIDTVPAKKSKKVKASRPDLILIGDDDTDLEYSFAKCCNPIPGDDIFGFITIGGGIKIHRTNCPNGIRLMSNYGYRIIKAKWSVPVISDKKTFPAGIKVTGIDSLGIVSKITEAISNDLKVNMQSITINAKHGAFEGFIILKISDTKHLEELLESIKRIQGIENVSRFQVEETLESN